MSEAKLEKKHIFWKRVLPIYAGAWALLFAFLLAALLYFLYTYEKYNINNVINSYTQEGLWEDFYKELEIWCSEKEKIISSSVIKSGEIFDYAKEILDGESVDIRALSSEWSDEERSYSVWIGNINMGRMVLDVNKNYSLPFGLEKWEISEVKFNIPELDLVKEVVINVPADEHVYVNGILLTSRNAVAENGLSSKISTFISAEEARSFGLDIEILTEYSFEACYNSVITVESEDGSVYTLKEDETHYEVDTIIQDELGDFYFEESPLEDGQGDEIREFCEEFINAYVAYTSKGGGTLSETLSYLVYGTAFYSRLVSTGEPLSWVFGQTSTLESLEISNVLYLGDSAFCFATYTLETFNSHSEELHERLYLSKGGSTWKIRDMSVFE